jgi:hypothetical protein
VATINKDAVAAVTKAEAAAKDILAKAESNIKLAEVGGLRVRV